jgi:hypothetical protein
MEKTRIYDLSRKVGALIAMALIALWTLPAVLIAPSSEIDSHWQIGLQLAFLQKLQFGKDLVFTMGPLGFLYVPLFVHPKLWEISFLFALFIHLLVLASLILFARKVATGFAGMALILVALPFALPVISLEYRMFFAIALLSYLVLTPDGSRRTSCVMLGFVAVLMATATMIKLTAFMMATGIFAAVAVISVKRKQYGQPILLVVVFALAWAFLWELTGQDFAYIPAYFANSMEISAGYTAGMAVDGKALHFYLAILAIAVIVFSCVTSATKGNFRPLLLAILLGGSLLVSYKQGFVRQDKSHVVYFFGNTMLMLAVLYPLLSKTTKNILGRALILACFFALAGGIYDAYRGDVLAPRFGAKSEGIPVFLKKPQVTRRLGVMSLCSSLSLMCDTSRQEKFQQESMAQIRHTLPLCDKTLGMVAGKTIDVFPWDVALVYAYGLNWSPRPVFQSYSAYTKKLDLLNASHFGGTGSPCIILFSYKRVDRYPIFDEPETFRTILRNYRILGTDGEFLLLERKNIGLEEKKDDYYREIGVTQYARLGQPISVPSRNEGRVFARVFLKYNWIGRIVDLLYKPSHVYIRLKERRADLTAPRYRFIPDQARNGILLSAHVHDLSGLMNLFSPDGQRCGQIEEITIEADSTWQYTEPFKVEFFAEPWGHCVDRPGADHIPAVLPVGSEGLRGDPGQPYGHPHRKLLPLLGACLSHRQRADNSMCAGPYIA